MLELRQAAQKVVEVWKLYGTTESLRGWMEILGAALAEPDLFHCPNCGGPADNGHDRSIPPNPYFCTRCMAYVSLQNQNTELDQKLAELERKLAEETQERDRQQREYEEQRLAALGCDHCNSPLYAAIKCKVCGRVTEPAPPQRKPLTEKEIDSIWDSEKAFADIYAIVRAIERAHGIGGQP